MALKSENGGVFLTKDAAIKYWKTLAKKRQEKIRNAIYALENNKGWNADMYIEEKVLKILKTRSKS